MLHTFLISVVLATLRFTSGLLGVYVRRAHFLLKHTLLMHASLSTMRASSPTMLARFKSFTLDDGNSCLEFIEPSYALDNQNYMDLHSLLEEGFIVDWPLAF